MLTQNIKVFRFLFVFAVVFLSITFVSAQEVYVPKNDSSINGTIAIEGNGEMPKEFRFLLLKSGLGQRISSTLNFSHNAQDSLPQTFYIGNLNSGKYRIIFNNSNYYVKSVAIDGKTFSGETFIEVKSGEQLSGVHIVLADDFGAVTGKVENYNGEPRARVVLMKEESEISQIYARGFTVLVKPNGEFSLRAVPGEYRIFFNTPNDYENIEAKAEEWLNKMIKTSPKIIVNAGETVNVTVKIPEK